MGSRGTPPTRRPGSTGACRRVFVCATPRKATGSGWVAHRPVAVSPTCVRLISLNLDGLLQHRRSMLLRSRPGRAVLPVAWGVRAVLTWAFAPARGHVAAWGPSWPRAGEMAASCPRIRRLPLTARPRRPHRGRHLGWRVEPRQGPQDRPSRPGPGASRRHGPTVEASLRRPRPRVERPQPCWSALWPTQQPRLLAALAP
jgi:hypothetical protein